MNYGKKIIIVAAVGFVAIFFYLPLLCDYATAKDAEYSEWSTWSVCTKLCGHGRKVRYRNCSKPSVGSGKTCDEVGDRYDFEICLLKKCPIHGMPGQWGAWEKCNIDCKEGIRSRRRECDNPKPQNSGLPCQDALLEEGSCPSEAPCPIDGKYVWSEWGSCSVTCGKGKEARTNECEPPAHGGKPCSEDNKANDETRDCETKLCPIDGSYKPWNEYGTCSVTCGKGKQTRTRECEPPKNGGKPCLDNGKTESKDCVLTDCPAQAVSNNTSVSNP